MREWAKLEQTCLPAAKSLGQVLSLELLGIVIIWIDPFAVRVREVFFPVGILAS